MENLTLSKKARNNTERNKDLAEKWARELLILLYDIPESEIIYGEKDAEDYDLIIPSRKIGVEVTRTHRDNKDKKAHQTRFDVRRILERISQELADENPNFSKTYRATYRLKSNLIGDYKKQKEIKQAFQNFLHNPVKKIKMPHVIYESGTDDELNLGYKIDNIEIWCIADKKHDLPFVVGGDTVWEGERVDFSQKNNAVCRAAEDKWKKYNKPNSKRLRYSKRWLMLEDHVYDPGVVPIPPDSWEKIILFRRAEIDDSRKPELSDFPHRVIKTEP